MVSLCNACARFSLTRPADSAYNIHADTFTITMNLMEYLMGTRFLIISPDHEWRDVGFLWTGNDGRHVSGFNKVFAKTFIPSKNPRINRVAYVAQRKKTRYVQFNIPSFSAGSRMQTWLCVGYTNSHRMQLCDQVLAHSVSERLQKSLTECATLACRYLDV